MKKQKTSPLITHTNKRYHFNIQWILPIFLILLIFSYWGIRFIKNLTYQNVYNNILIEESVEDLKNAKSPEIVLDLRKFNNEEKVIKSRILLYTITRLLGSSKGIEKIHIEDVIKLCSNNIGNKYLTPNKNIKILIKNHKIYFLSQV